MALTRLLSALLAALLGIVAALLLYAGALLTPSAGAAELGAPAAATHAVVEDRLMYPSTAISTTTYSSSSLAGRDPRVINGWAGGDAFITADFASTGTLTTTVQFSADGVNWASGVVMNASGAEVALTEVLSADGTGMIHIPMAGQYVRFAMNPGSDTVTPTIRLVLREPFTTP